MDDAKADNTPAEQSKPDPPTVWMRALRYHTPHGRRQNEGDIYLAHEHEVENLINLGFARREPPPPTAVRAPINAAPVRGDSSQEPPAPPKRQRKVARPMTTGDVPGVKPQP